MAALAMLSLAACKDDHAQQSDESTTGDVDTSAGPASSTVSGESGSSGAESADSTGSETDTDTGETPSYLPPPGGLRRLLAHQYIASVELVLGPEAAAVAEPPIDQTLGGFDSIAAAELSPSPADIEQYERTANAIAEAAVQNPATLAQTVPCVLDAVPAASCYQQVATDIGRLLWRRPLTDDEVNAYTELAFSAQAWGDGDFWPGVQYMLIGLLQSPRFVYIVEIGEPAADGVARELGPYEMAARLSFFMVGRTPDAALLDLAEAGNLATDDDVRNAAWSLLDDPRAQDTVARFYDEFLTIRDLPTKGKSAELFPNFDSELAASMREETQRLIADIVFTQDGNVLDMFDSTYTWVDADLAALYGVNAPAPGTWAQVQLPGDQGRAGVLTHPSMMAMLSHGEINSPTRRGLFVQEQLLCTDIPPVPPGVNPVLPEPAEPMSLRDRLEMVHYSDASCMGCHTQMDPIGFAFEHFDPIGAYRTLDNGFVIDSTGTLGGVGDFGDASDLMALLKEDQRLHRCLVNQAYTNALGFTRTIDQEAPLSAIDDEFESSEYNLKHMLVELAASPVFRRVDEPK